MSDHSLIHSFYFYFRKSVKTTQLYEKGKTLQNARVMACLVFE